MLLTIYVKANALMKDRPSVSVKVNVLQSHSSLQMLTSTGIAKVVAWRKGI
jgi:hypothetical protein